MNFPHDESIERRSTLAERELRISWKKKERRELLSTRIRAFSRLLPQHLWRWWKSRYSHRKINFRPQLPLWPLSLVLVLVHSTRMLFSVKAHTIISMGPCVLAERWREKAIKISVMKTVRRLKITQIVPIVTRQIASSLLLFCLPYQYIHETTISALHFTMLYVLLCGCRDNVEWETISSHWNKLRTVDDKNVCVYVKTARKMCFNKSDVSMVKSSICL